MKSWPLAALQGLRAAQARGSTRGAATLRAEAARALGAAEEIARQAAAWRRSAATRGSLPPSRLAGELARGAASRTEIDRAARRAARDGERAAAEADRVKRRALEAAAAARESRGRAGALARGMARFEEQRRRAREARRERDVEEAWIGTRQGLSQVEPGPALLADDLEPPRAEVPGSRLAGALELGRGENHLLARAQCPLLVLPGPVEREHDVGPDLVRLVAHQDLLATQEGVLEDVDVGPDRVSRPGGRAGDPEGQERCGDPAAQDPETHALPAAGLPEAVDEASGRAAPVVERPLDEARDALRSFAHGERLPFVRGGANVSLEFPRGTCARRGNRI